MVVERSTCVTLAIRAERKTLIITTLKKRGCAGDSSISRASRASSSVVLFSEISERVPPTIDQLKNKIMPRTILPANPELNPTNT